MTTISIVTSVTSRIIKQAIQALSKAQAIEFAYKIFSKTYERQENGRIKTINSQIIVFTTGLNRDKSGESILTNILKDRRYLEKIL